MFFLQCSIIVSKFRIKLWINLSQDDRILQLRISVHLKIFSAVK
jgi:hypothetical protein